LTLSGHNTPNHLNVGHLLKPLSDPRPAILVCDDEEPIRQILRAQLTARGYFVHEASTGNEVLSAVPALRPDVIILDLGLPDADGTEVIQRLRLSSKTPVIVLSVRAVAADKIAALDAGADDYLTKPCQPVELDERIRAMLFRAKFQGAVFEVSDLVVDLHRRKVHIDQSEIQLTATEYDLLKVLVLNAGRLLTQRRLTHEVWGEKRDDEALRLLRTTIGTLREKLEPDPARPRHIAMEPGVGYRLRTER
jgi:two-component system, OmpR family, KDP operon response regulator KdpE